MKITQVNVFAIQTPIPEPFYYSMGYVNRRSSVIVEIETDEENGKCKIKRHTLLYVF